MVCVVGGSGVAGGVVGGVLFDVLMVFVVHIVL